jgi:hypothetical protein
MFPKSVTGFEPVPGTQFITIQLEDATQFRPYLDIFHESSYIRRAVLLP